MTRRVNIHGERGRWLAEVEGAWLAVIHTTWRQGATGYHDPMAGAKIDGARYTEFVQALRDHDRVVIQRDKPGTFDRDGYVGVFKFTSLEIRPDGAVSLILTERLADPA
jgi:hypothetical protein